MNLQNFTDFRLLTEAKNSLKMNVPSDILDLHKLFKKNGKELFVVGGAVRDALLGKKPKDFDLATDAFPAEVIDIDDVEDEIDDLDASFQDVDCR